MFSLALAVLWYDVEKLIHAAQHYDLIPLRLDLCRRLFQAEEHTAAPHTAFATAEQGSALVFLGTLGQGRSRLLAGIHIKLKDEEEEALRDVRLLEPRLDKECARDFGQRDPALIGHLFDDRRAAEAQLQTLIARLHQDYPRYADLRYPCPCSVAEARACLQCNEVALLFAPGSKGSAVLLLEARPAKGVKADGLAIYSLPTEADLADLVDALTDPETLARPARVNAPGQQDYAKLLVPLQERLRGKNLVIVAGGPLGYLPFELLVDPDGKYLLESRRLRYAPSLTAPHMIRVCEQKLGRHDRPLWALGDPVFATHDPRAPNGIAGTAASRQMQNDYLTRLTRTGRPGPLEFGRLPGSAVEVASIREVLQADRDAVVTGLVASEATVKKLSEKDILRRMRYVHFATHGILTADSGRQPALVLNLVGNDSEDGFLELTEVLGLRLNADLVVLSACRSGQGWLNRGEGSAAWPGRFCMPAAGQCWSTCGRSPTRKPPH